MTKHYILNTFFLTLLNITMVYGSEEVLRAGRYDINVRNADVRRVFQTIADRAGLGLDLAADVSGNISVNVFNKTLTQTIQTVSKKAHLSYSIVDGILHIHKSRKSCKQG